jgi:hypothetical protein
LRFKQNPVVERESRNQIAMNDSNGAIILAYEYLRLQLEHAGLNYHNLPDSILDLASRELLPFLSPDKVNALFAVCKVFENLNYETMSEEVKKIDIDLVSISQTFDSAAKQLFSPGKTNWGRVITYFVLGGLVAEKCMKTSNKYLVSTVGEVIGVNLRDKVLPWFKENPNAWNNLAILHRALTNTFNK